MYAVQEPPQEDQCPTRLDLPFTTSEQTFLSEGTACAARVYRPAARPSAADDPRPVIVMGHGFGGVRALRLYAYAERFVAAGYLVVVFDYRGFGESEGSPRSCSTSACNCRTGVLH